MKKIKIYLAFTAAVMITFGLGATAMAFHDGGVAHCDGCHTMHNTGAVSEGVIYTDNEHLLKGPDTGTVCLNCHEGDGTYHVLSTDRNGGNYSPGGDFAWMTLDFTWTAHGDPQESLGRNHGHNVIADGFGLEADTVNTVAPGGSYQAIDLSCASCHDPHGKKVNKTGPIVGSGSYGTDLPADAPAGAVLGNFRLLGDDGYDAGSSVQFTEPVPTAITFSPFGGPGADEESDDRHTDYGTGMSEWCTQCHTGFDQGEAGGKHPSDSGATLGDLEDNYNRYRASGDLSATPSDSYFALVPFERGAGVTATDLNPTSLEGPATTSNVMCLSCHRAHASAFKFAGRWDFTVEFLKDSHPNGNTTSGPGIDEPDGSLPIHKENSYYGRDIATVYGPYQRALCNKCHLQD